MMNHRLSLYIAIIIPLDDQFLPTKTYSNTPHDIHKDGPAPRKVADAQVKMNTARKATEATHISGLTFLALPVTAMIST